MWYAKTLNLSDLFNVGVDIFWYKDNKISNSQISKYLTCFGWSFFKLSITDNFAVENLGNIHWKIFDIAEEAIFNSYILLLDENYEIKSLKIIIHLFSLFQLKNTSWFLIDIEHYYGIVYSNQNRCEIEFSNFREEMS
jgi:hypothetical protein